MSPTIPVQRALVYLDNCAITLSQDLSEHGGSMPSPYLQDLVRNMRLRGYAIRTQKTYLHWIRSA